MDSLTTVTYTENLLLYLKSLAPEAFPDLRPRFLAQSVDGPTWLQDCILRRPIQKDSEHDYWLKEVWGPEGGAPWALS